MQKCLGIDRSDVLLPISCMSVSDGFEDNAILNTSEHTKRSRKDKGCFDLLLSFELCFPIVAHSVQITLQHKVIYNFAQVATLGTTSHTVSHEAGATPL